jgi:hypothetical protein
MERAETYEEIEPLIGFCKAGKLFDAQAWVARGKPVNPPTSMKRNRRRIPLQVAIDTGFHSMVQILLEAGALLNEPSYCPLEHALSKRRLDMVKLLVEHGADVRSVDMGTVFETWDNEIVDFFINHGADLETDNPLARALCWKIRTALGIFKRYKDRYSTFHEQVNIALRHHCREGNLKWVSLMLWAGADPFAKGMDSPFDKSDLEEYSSAMELAAFYGHHDIFKLKQIRLDPGRPDGLDLLRASCHGDKSDLLVTLLEKGFDPKDLQDKGSSLIQSILNSMSWDFNPFSFSRRNKDIDSARSREKMKMIHLLVRYGARLEPQDRIYINDVRRSLLKLTPDHAMEFVWIMSEYNACSLQDIEALMKTPTIKALVSKHAYRLDELMASFRKVKVECHEHGENNVVAK